jgi:hypothetical protein
MSVETFVVQTADGTANTTGTRASAINAGSRVQLPSSFFYIGRVVRFLLGGRISSVITTPGTARYDICMGSAGTTIVWDSLAILLDSVAAHTTVKWSLDVVLRCTAVGATTTTTFFPEIGEWKSEDILGVPATAPKGVLTAMLPWNTTPAIGAGMDNTASSIIDVFFTQTVGTGSHTVHSYIGQALN